MAWKAHSEFGKRLGGASKGTLEDDSIIDKFPNNLHVTHHFRLRNSLWSGSQCPSDSGRPTHALCTLRKLKYLYINHKTNLLLYR